MGIFLKTVCSARLVKQTRNVSYQKLKTWYVGLFSPRPFGPPYKHITQIGDPVLRTVSKTVPEEEISSSEIQFLIKHMSSIFQQYKCIGLSAVQIGIPLRVFMMEVNKGHLKDFDEAERKSKEMCLIPRTVVINPKVKVTDYTKTVFSEACLSVRGYFGDVPRYRSVTLTGSDENGKPIIINADGWTARIIQHEVDHMDGKLYTDTMDRKSFTCNCWHVINERNGKVLLPYGPD